MLAMEEILVELSGGDERSEQGGLPPGFRFHPTDEELITFYLASKVFNGSFCGVQIAEVDLNRCEPWELPEVAKMGEREWYFFSLRDRKYPTGLRTNRATGAGYWKATGKDREVYTTTTSSSSNGSSGSLLIGMKKTLVFYKGRAPRGEKTKWVMHEYRLDGDFSCRQTSKEEWVICRIFHKMTEKKNPLLQGQSSYNMLKNGLSPNSGSLPPLLETSTATLMQSHYQNLQNPPLLIPHQESDLKALISPAMSQQHCTPLPINSGLFEPYFSAPSNSIAPTPSNKGICINDYSSSTSINIFIKSLLSHQDCALKELANTISKQYCKSDQSSCLHCQLSDRNHHQQQQQQQQSNFHENPTTLAVNGILDCCNTMGLNASTVHEMSSSSSAAFGRAGGFQMLLDTAAPTEVASDSWALDA